MLADRHADLVHALSLIPLGEVTAISFLAPLFGTLGAIFVLGEVVRWRRWAALVVGFGGAMIILRPSGASIGVGQLCAILSAMTMGLTAILVKQLTARDDPDKIVFLTNLLLTPLSLLPALFVWQMAAAGGVAAGAGHGAVRHARPHHAGARLRGDGGVAGHDLRVLAPAVRNPPSAFWCSPRALDAGPGSARW